MLLAVYCLNDCIHSVVQVPACGARGVLAFSLVFASVSDLPMHVDGLPVRQQHAGHCHIKVSQHTVQVNLPTSIVAWTGN